MSQEKKNQIDFLRTCMTTVMITLEVTNICLRDIYHMIPLGKTVFEDTMIII